MTDHTEDIQYIHCARCSNKCIKDDEHIKNTFGYNRNNEIFKQCIKCRERNKYNRSQPHRIEQQRSYYNSRTEENKEHSRRQYLKNKGEYLKKVQCEICGKEVCNGQINRHQKSKGCKIPEPKQNPNIDNDEEIECEICGKCVKYKNLQNHRRRTICDDWDILKHNVKYDDVIDESIIDSWNKVKTRIDMHDPSISWFNVNSTYMVVPIYEDRKMTDKYFLDHHHGLMFRTPDLVRLVFNKENTDDIHLEIVDKRVRERRNGNIIL